MYAHAQKAFQLIDDELPAASATTPQPQSWQLAHEHPAGISSNSLPVGVCQPAAAAVGASPALALAQVHMPRAAHLASRVHQGPVPSAAAPLASPVAVGATVTRGTLTDSAVQQNGWHMPPNVPMQLPSCAVVVPTSCPDGMCCAPTLYSTPARDAATDRIAAMAPKSSKLGSGKPSAMWGSHPTMMPVSAGHMLVSCPPSPPAQPTVEFDPDASQSPCSSETKDVAVAAAVWTGLLPVAAIVICIYSQGLYDWKNSPLSEPQIVALLLTMHYAFRATAAALSPEPDGASPAGQKYFRAVFVVLLAAVAACFVETYSTVVDAQPEPVRTIRVVGMVAGFTVTAVEIGCQLMWKPPHWRSIRFFDTLTSLLRLTTTCLLWKSNATAFTPAQLSFPAALSVEAAVLFITCFLLNLRSRRALAHAVGRALPRNLKQWGEP